ncbi:MAG: histidine kinase [Thermoleophilia bacterium]
MDEPKSLEETRRELEEKRIYLADLRASLPRHSIRPHQLIEIEDTEEVIQELVERVAQLEGDS